MPTVVCTAVAPALQEAFGHHKQPRIWVDVAMLASVIGQVMRCSPRWFCVVHYHRRMCSGCPLASQAASASDSAMVGWA